MDLFDIVRSFSDVSLSMALSSVFILGLIGTPHCVGMCGVLCLIVCPSKRSTGFYQFGRLTSYLILGSLFGTLGGMIYHEAQYSLIWVGLFVATIALALGALKMAGPRFNFLLSGYIKGKRGSFVALSAGLASGLLPCGFLHFVLGIAAVSGDWSRGALIIFAFWFGTVPGFYFASYLMRRFSIQKSIFARYAFLASGIAFIVLAYGFRSSNAILQSEKSPNEAICHSTTR